MKYVIHDSVLRNYWNIRNCIRRTINRLIKTDSIMAIPKSIRLNVSSTSASVTTSKIVNVTALKFQYWNKCDMLSQFLLMKCCFMSNGEEIKWFSDVITYATQECFHIAVTFMHWRYVQYIISEYSIFLNFIVFIKQGYRLHHTALLISGAPPCAFSVYKQLALLRFHQETYISVIQCSTIICQYGLHGNNITQDFITIYSYLVTVTFMKHMARHFAN